MSKESTLMEKAKLALKALFTAADKETIEKFKAELADAVTPAVEPKKVKTKEGVELTVEGDLVAGSKVSMPGENGELVPVMDGVYLLDDGSELYVTGGLITKVEKTNTEEGKKPEVAETEMAAKMAAQVKEFDAKLTEAVKPLSATIEAQAKVIDALKEQQKFLLSKFESIYNAPVITEQVTPEKSWEEMTPLERRRFKKTNNQ